MKRDDNETFEDFVFGMLSEIRERMRKTPEESHMSRAREQVCVAVLRVIHGLASDPPAQAGNETNLRSFLQREMQAALRESALFEEVRWRKNAGAYKSKGSSAWVSIGEQLPLPLFDEAPPERTSMPRFGHDEATTVEALAPALRSPSQLDLFDDDASTSMATANSDSLTLVRDRSSRRPDTATSLWDEIEPSDLLAIVRDCLRQFPAKKLHIMYDIPLSVVEAAHARVDCLLNLFERLRVASPGS